MTAYNNPESALRDIAVVDLSTTVAAAVAARLLAEAGADVVKVEGPDGDPLRDIAPVGFATWNRSKRGVVLDLAEPDGRVWLDDLLARADVLVHDRTPAGAAELGLDEASLAERFPALVVAAVTAFPDWHPRHEAPAEEILVQAESGVMDEQQGNRPGPIYTRLPYATWSAAFLLTGGILARLVQRARAGLVGNVRTSLLQGALVPTSLYWQRSDRLPAEAEAPHTLPKAWPGASLSLFECGDGEWIQLAGSLGGWIESPPVLEMLAIRDEVDLSETGVTPENRPRWQEVFRSHDASTWLAKFAEVDVPCMQVRDLGECFHDEQALINGYVVDVDDPVIGPSTQVAAPFTMDLPCAVRKPAPRPGGESTVLAVLGSFGGNAARDGLRRVSASVSPLAGFTVLDFGSMVAAPFAAQCFADFGARVVKVERLGGERGRTLTQFAGSNRGKESFAVDLKNPEAAELVQTLISSADIVVHNIRAGAAARLGVDRDSLHAINERVVLTHVSSNGSLGPMSEYPGYDPTAQALTGWERANVGHGQDPMWMRNSVLDVASGLAAFVGGLIGLYRREVTGHPGDCATSLLAVGMTIASETALAPSGKPFSVPQIDPGQTGTSQCHRIYRAADGWFALVARTDEQRRATGAVAGAEEDGFAEAFATWRRDDVLAALKRAGVPAAVVRENAMDDFFDEPRNREHGIARRLHAEAYGVLDVIGGYWTLTPPGERPTDPKETVPAGGADTVAVLAAAGYTTERIAELLAENVVESSIL